MRLVTLAALLSLIRGFTSLLPSPTLGQLPAQVNLFSGIKRARASWPSENLDMMLQLAPGEVLVELCCFQLVSMGLGSSARLPVCPICSREPFCNLKIVP